MAPNFDQRSHRFELFDNPLNDGVLTRMAKTLASAACALSLIPFLGVGCSPGNGNDIAASGSGGTTASNGGAPAGGAATTSAISGIGGSTVNIFGSAGGAASTGVEACASKDTPAQPAPLDIYLMLDISGSMLDRTTAGTTKWDAIKNALTSFLQGSGTDAISVGIQYFPLRKSGIPANCSSDAQCGSGDSCTLKWCTKYGTLVPNGIAVCGTDADCSAIPTLADYGTCSAGQCDKDAARTCNKDSDCQVTTNFNYGPCSAIGFCASAPTVACAPNTACGAGADGKDRGACVTATSSYCFHGTACDSATYATPAVEIAEIPGATSALVASLAAQAPEGDTPSAPALRGAIEHARRWAISHPSHTVVAVLATDGLPTECLPDSVRFSGTRALDNLVSEVESIAADGTEAAPPISTFVIGVFAGSDQAAPGNLERIARAGGTGRAQMVDTGGDVSKQFLEALNAVRASHLQCEFQIPQSTDGSNLDYFMVNVVHVNGTDKTPLPYVGKVERCDPVMGGWYYDDGAGIAPTKILVCPSNCDAFQSSTGSLQIALGCTTIIL